MNFIDTIVNKYLGHLQQLTAFFNNGGADQLYDKINKYPYTPFPFGLHAVWCCFAIRFARRNRNNTFFSKILMTLIAFICVFGSRSALAYYKHQKLPFIADIRQAQIFGAVALLIFFTPYSLFYRLLLPVAIFFIPAQAINQGRLLAICYRNRFKWYEASVLTNLEIYIIVILNLLNFTDTIRFAGIGTLIVNTVLFWGVQNYQFGGFTLREKWLMMVGVMMISQYIVTFIDMIKALNQWTNGSRDEYEKLLKQREKLRKEEKYIIPNKVSVRDIDTQTYESSFDQ